MNDFSTCVQQLIVPSEIQRPALRLPVWFQEAAAPAPVAGQGPCLLLSDSHGENFEDLLAAWQLNMGRCTKARMVVLDDQRHPEICAQTLRGVFADGWRPDAVVGHFSSPIARRVAALYAAEGVPFFAPGSSADDLAQDPDQPLFQLFARDSGQIDCLRAALRGQEAAVVCGEADNAGAQLMAALQVRPPCLLHCYGDPRDVPAAQARGRPLLLLGSKEYVATCLSALATGQQPAVVYLSDDSLDAAAVITAARQLDCPVRVAALDRPEAQLYQLGFALESIEADARRLLERAPGPYFLTAWMAIYLALRALRHGARTPAQMHATLTERPWQSAYGPLTFDACGRANGFTWNMRTVT